MSAFEQAKETVMLLITVVVLIFMTVFFYIIFGNYRIGSEIDISENEAEIVALRTLKCIDNNEKLDECIKTEKYGIKVQYSDRTLYVNEKLYNELLENYGNNWVYFFDNKPVISVIFKHE